jgi:hypothetical protein
MKEMEEALAAQAVVRASVQAVVDGINNFMEALRLIVCSSPENFQSHLPDTLRILSPLLSSPLFSDKATEVVKNLVLAANSSVSDIAPLVARALQVINTTTPLSQVVNKYPSIFVKVIGVLDALVSSHRQLTTATLHLAVGIMRAVILCEPLNELVDPCLRILAANTAVTIDSTQSLQLRLLRGESFGLHLCIYM